MKEKVLFISAIIGTFSATIILLITRALTIFGIDTSGYIDIINIVGVVLAFIILVVGVFFLNKYSTLQQKINIDQNRAVNTALEGNAQLMNNILPKLANDIMTAAEERATKLLRSTEDSVKTMMNEMLPELAKQTMEVVTKQSQDIVNQTTAKANAVMTSMDELIPTYADNISAKVAQTVRENNAHYHKMLSELKVVVNKLQLPNTTPTTPTIDMDTIITPIQLSVETMLADAVAKIVAAQPTIQYNTDSLKVPDINLFTPDEEEEIIVEEPDEEEEIIVEEPDEEEAQNDETPEKSDETQTA